LVEEFAWKTLGVGLDSELRIRRELSSRGEEEFKTTEEDQDQSSENQRDCRRTTLSEE